MARAQLGERVEILAPVAVQLLLSKVPEILGHAEPGMVRLGLDCAIAYDGLTKQRSARGRDAAPPHGGRRAGTPPLTDQQHEGGHHSEAARRPCPLHPA